MMAQTLARIASRAAAYVPLSLYNAVAGEDLVIPVYHTVSDDDLAHVKHLYHYKSVADFRRDLEFFCTRFQPISLEDLLDARRSGRTLPKGSLLLTFDDGMREVAEVIAPILIEKGVPATFFLTTRFLDNEELFFKHKASLLTEALLQQSESSRRNNVESIQALKSVSWDAPLVELPRIEYRDREVLDEVAAILDVDFSAFLHETKPYLTSDQVERLVERGFSVGSHSLDHPLYSDLDLQEQLGQTLRGAEYLRKRFSIDSSTFAFPFHDRNVPLEFFQKTTGSGELDAIFGTSSMMSDAAPGMFQRTIMETLPISAQEMLATRYLRKILRRSLGRNVLSRR